MSTTSAAYSLDVMQLNAGNGLPSLSVHAFDSIGWVMSQAALRDPAGAETPEQKQARENAAKSDVDSRVEQLRKEGMGLLEESLKKGVKSAVGDTGAVHEYLQGLKEMGVLVIVGVLLLAFGLWQVSKD